MQQITQPLTRGEKVRLAAIVSVAFVVLYYTETFPFAERRKVDDRAAIGLAQKEERKSIQTEEVQSIQTDTDSIQTEESIQTDTDTIPANDANPVMRDETKPNDETAPGQSSAVELQAEDASVVEPEHSDDEQSVFYRTMQLLFHMAISWSTSRLLSQLVGDSLLSSSRGYDLLTVCSWWIAMRALGYGFVAIAVSFLVANIFNKK